ncbi:aconitate hydratase AcnA [Chitinasiproducens palmae]|uniref:Aconitate hydratase n=1 Tax=Chitinasiproducens palmae TaxID=1770053 RepID=A0A1H2PKX3_9BURK|nr:aconitate hydratase AcnA [Chitinasiproducens palmae]SDV47012.1 aconitate hydratase [Chitinasiproducens palmae]
MNDLRPAALRETTRRDLALSDGRTLAYYSLPALAAHFDMPLARVPVSLRVMLESVLRHLDGLRASEAHLRALLGWQAQADRYDEVPFLPARIIAPDSSGVPLLADLAAMRDAAAEAGADPGVIRPQLPVDVIVDHSVQVDHYGSANALLLNEQLEYARNGERYAFIKWAGDALAPLRVAPPGTGIIHQVNLEYWSPGVVERDGVLFPDTLIGADSHTAMINGLGVLGWGVGGIEAEAAMLGQPVMLLMPDVIGVELRGALREGVTATDAVLSITERLRAESVVGQFVEFHGQGAAALGASDRATIANMAPEYGATAAFFPVDVNTLAYYRATGRSEAQVDAIQRYYEAQEMFGVPRAGECDYTRCVIVDLSAIEPCVAGPKRPQDRIALATLPQRFAALLQASRDAGGFAVTNDAPATALQHGDIVLAAITSCTNTSNPALMIAAGLLARRATARGLRVRDSIKTSLAPGSRVVTAYLSRLGLQDDLDRLGFQVVGYGCTTCIGNGGPLAPDIEEQINLGKLVVCSVLSGNRNFEARIHPAIRANFLMSPPLVVAFALAGRIGINFASEALGRDPAGEPVYLRDLWPSQQEIDALLPATRAPSLFDEAYSTRRRDAAWDAVAATPGIRFAWDEASTYLKRPPFFDGFSREASRIESIEGARALLVLGDSVTTDHISPGGIIGEGTSAGRYLQSIGIGSRDFNGYIARRGNHHVMMRGTFANVRLKNRMALDAPGGTTVHWPDGERTSVYDAACRYQAAHVPTVVFAGAEYGTGSSRDWAAKGTRLLGVRAVIARSFERIHRSNLIGMGVLPLEFVRDDSIDTLRIDGSEQFDIALPHAGLAPRQMLELVIRRADGSRANVTVLARLDTPIECLYFTHGGILPYVLRQAIAEGQSS